MRGTLKVSLLRAEGLPNVEWRATGGVQDPYVVLCVGAQTYKSLVHENGGTSPVWNQNFTFEAVTLDQELVVEIWDKNWWWKDVPIGNCRIPMQEVAATDIPGGVLQLRMPVQRAGKSHYEGKLDIDLHYIRPAQQSNGLGELVRSDTTASRMSANNWGSAPHHLPPHDLGPPTSRPPRTSTDRPLPTPGAHYPAPAPHYPPPVPHYPPAPDQQGVLYTPASSSAASPAESEIPLRQRLMQQQRPGGAAQQQGAIPPTPSTVFAATPLVRPATWILPSPHRDRNSKAEYREWVPLGNNQFGKTYKATHLASGQKFAIKVLSKSRLLADPQAPQALVTEVELLQELRDHPHVVRLHDAWESSKEVGLVMELCRGGEVFEALERWGHYQEQDAAHIMRTIVGLVADLHKAGIMHRDLKPENFLFLEPGDKRQTLKATGFFTATRFQPGEALQEVVGSSSYVAPEVLDEDYGPAADMWSCGVILYALLSGDTPYQGYSAEGVVHAIRTTPLDLTSGPWAAISNAAKDCVRQLLQVDPAQRASAEQILQHEWLREGGAAGAVPLVLEGLSKFSSANKLTKLALKITAACLPAHEKEGLRQLFREVDLDRSGTVSAAELLEALHRRGQVLRRADVEHMMRAADLNGDKEMDFEEFVAVMLSLEGLQQAALRNVFTQLDLDGNGTIEVEEMRQALQQQGLSEEDIPRIIAEADTDGDSTISFDEFCQMMQKI